MKKITDHFAPWSGRHFVTGADHYTVRIEPEGLRLVNENR